MNISCGIIEDLLPIYYDGVCSGDSVTLIEAHLAACPSCQAKLDALRVPIPTQHSSVSDFLSPLRALNTRLKRHGRAMFGKGILMTLCGLALLLSVWLVIWYMGNAHAYAELAKPLEPVPREISEMTSASRYLLYGEHCIVLSTPHLLGRDGFVHVGLKESMPLFLQDGSASPAESPPVDLFFYPDRDGYRFALMLDDGSQKWWVWIAPDLTVFEDDLANRTEAERETINGLLSEHRETILSLFDTVRDVWGIEYLLVE